MVNKKTKQKTNNVPEIYKSKNAFELLTIHTRIYTSKKIHSLFFLFL